MENIAKDLSVAFHEAGVLKFGEFTLKDGRSSPFYLDLRVLIARPNLLGRIGKALAQHAVELDYSQVAGIPYAGLPIAVAMSLAADKPLVYPRKESKGYGTRRLVEGVFAPGERALVIDDVITSGTAKLEAIALLREAGLVVNDVLVIVRRGNRGVEALQQEGLHVHWLLDVRDIVAQLEAVGALPSAQARIVIDFLDQEG